MNRSAIAFFLVVLLTSACAYVFWQSDFSGSRPRTGSAQSPTVPVVARIGEPPATSGKPSRMSRPVATKNGARPPDASGDEGQSDPALRPPPGRYVDSVSSLRERAAKGDRDAAYVLAMALSDCYLTAKGQLADGNGDPARCNGLNATSGEAIAQMQTAADRGLRAAQLIYPALTSELLTATDMIRDPAMVQDYKDRSMRYLLSAAEQGSGIAMMQLSGAYYRGIMTAPDLQLAYAYWYASAMLPGTGPSDDPRLIYGGNLTDEQIQAAQVLASKIYERCCQ